VAQNLYLQENYENSAQKEEIEGLVIQ